MTVSDLTAVELTITVTVGKKSKTFESIAQTFDNPWRVAANMLNNVTGLPADVRTWVEEQQQQQKVEQR